MRVFIDLRGPVVHDLLAAARKLVLGGAERGAQVKLQTGFLVEFACRRLGQALARVNLALRKRDVVVALAVHQQHANLAIDHPPAHSAGGEHGAAHRLVPARFTGGRSVILCIMTFCRSSRGEPSFLSWLRTHSPSGRSAQVAVSSDMARSKMVLISSRCAGSVRRTTTSTRRSRLRCMRSALPMNTCGSPPFTNEKMRECSR